MANQKEKLRLSREENAQKQIRIEELERDKNALTTELGSITS
jgi:hypothetical protein